MKRVSTVTVWKGKARVAATVRVRKTGEAIGTCEIDHAEFVGLLKSQWMCRVFQAGNEGLDGWKFTPFLLVSTVWSGRIEWGGEFRVNPGWLPAEFMRAEIYLEVG
ncbi:MAG: hypothetical protein ACRC7O_06320 [Fimbriiglobus sp.]